MKNSLVTFCLLVFGCLLSSFIFGQSGCPVFQNGNPGNPNTIVTFYTQQGAVVATCNCQLTGNELKCGNCKPNSNLWYYYTITINGVVMDCYNPVVLAVELGSFTGYQRDGKVHLAWETHSEVNNSHFRIERTENGFLSEYVGSVIGAGNATETQRYTFIDNNPEREKTYYRLVQEDFDGTETESQWINVVNDDEIHQLPIVPNPSRGEFSIYAQKLWDVKYVEICDIAGRCVFKSELVNGINQLSADLPNGTYFVSIVGTHKIVRSELSIHH